MSFILQALCLPFAISCVAAENTLTTATPLPVPFIIPSQTLCTEALQSPLNLPSATMQKIADEQLLPPNITPIFPAHIENSFFAFTCVAQQTPSLISKQTDDIAKAWLPLLQKLEADLEISHTLYAYFTSLKDYSPDPMVVKINELHRNAFEKDEKEKVPDTNEIPIAQRLYKGVVTQATIDKCKDFLKEHQKAFASMEKEYGLPKEAIVALLYVETRLGTFLGKENAFWSLAAMAASDSPEHVQESITHLSLDTEKEEWLQKKLEEKSNWAYAELKALLLHCATNGLDPHTMLGSVYGAIGICQFMPSNLQPFGADGDGDGKIDLFSPADAIHSTAKYLKAHGWVASSFSKQHTALRRYNNLTVYANTILALAESIQTNKLLTETPTKPIVILSAKAKPRAKAKRQR